MSCISKTACFSVNCTPLSLQFGRNEEPKGSNGSHLSECGNQTPPSKSGKKAPKKKRTSDVKTADPKPSTSQDQPQDESISEQQPQDESISEQPQGASTSEQQPQGEASTSTLQETVPSQFSDDDETLPDAWTMAGKAFATKDPRSIPKKPRYSLQPKTDYI